MGFIALSCPKCGAEITLDETREFGFCQYCGTKIVQDKQVIEHRGSVKIDHDEEIANLLMRGDTLSQQGRLLEAEKYYKKVLELDALNKEALRGLELTESVITEPNLFIERVPSLCAKDMKMNVVIDGKKVGKIAENDRLSFKVEKGEHTVMFYVTLYGKNKPIPFTIGGSFTKVHVRFKAKSGCKVDSEVDVDNLTTRTF